MNRDQFNEQINELDTVIQAVRARAEKLKKIDDPKVLKDNLNHIYGILDRNSKRIQTLYVIVKHYIPKD